MIIFRSNNVYNMRIKKYTRYEYIAKTKILEFYISRGMIKHLLQEGCYFFVDNLKRWEL